LISKDLQRVLVWVFVIASAITGLLFYEAAFRGSSWVPFFMSLVVVGAISIFNKSNINKQVVDNQLKDVKKSINKAQEVVRTYSAYMENTSKACIIGNLYDIKNLPYSKEEIKLSIKLMIVDAQQRENNKLVEWLKNGYVMLADFQEIAPDDTEILREHQTLLDQSSTIDQGNSTTIAEIDKQLEVSQAIMMKYMDRVNKEHNQLLKEIEGL
jgi:hypothetical protein